jgi:ABC-type lipoprotein export system ATPase subunit
MPTQHEADIVCHGLVRVFRSGEVEVQALQGLDLTVGRGELVAVVGRSGSGKSTLLSILSGLDRPTAGSAVVAGHELTRMRGAERVRFRRTSVGFVWQDTARNLLPYLTGAQNVAAAMTVARTAGARERRRRADEVLELVGVGEVRDVHPERMSGGQRQRVAVAVAIANRPRVLLADEPTGELDEAASAELLEVMRAVNVEHGLTTLIVTHDAAVSEHVRRTVRIRDGRTSTEVLRSTRLDDDGREHLEAQEYAVLDRAGRLQLPRAYLSALDLRDRVRLSLEPDHVAVRRDEAAAPGAGEDS